MVKYCAVPTCSNHYGLWPVFFCVPKCPQRRAAWFNRCPYLHRKTTPIESIRVCSAHFIPQYISPKNRLSRDAIPTENLPDFNSSATKCKQINVVQFPASSTPTDHNRSCAKCKKSQTEDPKMILYRFPYPGPSNARRAENWAKYCYPEKEWSSYAFQKSLYSSHKMLCYKHFPKTAFANYAQKKLYRYAAPCDSQDSEEQPSTSIQSMDVSTSEITTPDPIIDSLMRTPEKEKRLYNKCKRNFRYICKLRHKLKRMEKDVMLRKLIEDEAVIELCNHMEGSFAVRLQGRLKNYKRKPKERKWNINEKLIALTIFKRSPASYWLLRRLFSLPRQTKLKKILNRVPLKAGINTEMFETLKKKLEIQRCIVHIECECILIFDEMPIKKNFNTDREEDFIEDYQELCIQHCEPQEASHALVFMIVDIRTNFKQPIAYYFSGDSFNAEQVAVLTKEVLEQCFLSGFSICATVCVLDKVNRKALNILGVSTGHPFFNYNGNEIVALYDAPHLLKSFRNLFLKYDIKYPMDVSNGRHSIESIAKWEHLKLFYEIDHKNPYFVFAPALTECHINPNSKQKKKVEFATQIISHSVVGGMYAKISQGNLPAEAVATMNLIKKIHELFDALNSTSQGLIKGRKYSGSISCKSPHLDLFKKMIPFIKSLQFVGLDQKPPSQEAWIQTISGIELLWNNLKKKHRHFGRLATRRLQQDPLENCFERIKSYCGSNAKPTVRQFEAALKTAILTNLRQFESHLRRAVTTGLPHKPKYTNCKEDEAVILDNLQSFLTKKSPNKSSIRSSSLHKILP